MICAYRKLWSGRSSAQKIETEEELEQHVGAELRDELNHPRLRRPKSEKLAIALARIDESDLSEEEKQQLRRLYKKAAEQE